MTGAFLGFYEYLQAVWLAFPQYIQTVILSISGAFIFLGFMKMFRK